MDPAGRLLHKIGFGVGVVRAYRTWPQVILGHFGLPGRGGKDRMTHAMRDGALYRVRPGTNDTAILNEIYVVKEYHRALAAVREGSVVVDVGAQIGGFSVLAARTAPGVRVFSYEPFPENYGLLVENIRLNGLGDRVKAFRLGVGRAREERDLFVNPSDSGGHSMFGEGGRGEAIRIGTVSLEDVLRDNGIRRCDLLKMDCEGAEYEALLGAPDSTLERIGSIALEYHGTGDVGRLKGFLEGNGFRVSLHKGLPLLFAEREKAGHATSGLASGKER
jgi:FkbM family methyltransferase